MTAKPTVQCRLWRLLVKLIGKGGSVDELSFPLASGNMRDCLEIGAESTIDCSAAGSADAERPNNASTSAK